MKEDWVIEPIDVQVAGRGVKFRTRGRRMIYERHSGGLFRATGVYTIRLFDVDGGFISQREERVDMGLFKIAEDQSQTGVDVMISVHSPPVRLTPV